MMQSETTQPHIISDKSLIVNFFREIRSSIPKSELETNLWVTKKGVFIKTDYTDSVLKAFCQWYQTTTGGAIAPEKASRKLFNEDEQHEYYLIQGSSVVVGIVSECPTSDLRAAGIRLYEGIPIDTATSLHQTDPLFSSVPGLSCTLTRSGFEACFESRHGKIKMTFELLIKFRAWLHQTGEMRKYLNSSTIRKCMESLRRSLDFVKKVGRKWNVLIPARILEMRDIRLVSLGSIYFVIQDESIIDFFATRGKSLQDLIREELNLLIGDPKSRVLAGARAQMVKGSFLATKDVAGLSHTFGVSAVQSFLEQFEAYAERNRERLPGRLEPHHTVRECVIEIAKLLSDAEPILQSKVSGRVMTELPNAYAFLVSKAEWYFSVDNHKMIRQVLFAPKHVKKEITLIQLPQKNREDTSS